MRCSIVVRGIMDLPIKQADLNYVPPLALLNAMKECEDLSVEILPIVGPADAETL